MPVASSETPAQDFITESDLMRRLPEQGVAIDPEKRSEVDDSIWAEPLRTKRGLSRVQVHLADGGLLYGHDEIIAQARSNGWSEYFDDDTPDNLMMDEDVALHGLSLNVGHHGTEYAPAVTVAFTFDSYGRKITDSTIYKSRVAAQPMSYEGFEESVRRARKGAPNRQDNENRFIYLRAREIARPPGKTSSFRAGRVGKLTVANYMIVANSLIAQDRLAHNRPWLFRNHHMHGLEHPQADLLAHLYPDLMQFVGRRMAWYSRIPTTHQNIGALYCHFTSPLRRFPDLANHLNLHADLEGLPQMFDDDEIDEIAREMGHKIVSALNAGQEMPATQAA